MNKSDSYLAKPDDNQVAFSAVVSVSGQALLLLFTLVVSLISNLLVFAVFYHRPALRSLSNRFVLSLVTSNVLCAVLLMPLALVTLLMQQWVFSAWCCKAFKVVMMLLTVACTLSLMLIALDRYLAVMSPLHYGMIITRFRCSLMIGCIWAVATLLAVMPVVGLDDGGRILSHPETLLPCGRAAKDGLLCSLDPRNASDTRPELMASQSAEFWLCDSAVTTTVVSLMSQSHQKWFSVTLILIGFVLPLLLISWVYTCMYRAAHQTSARARKHSTALTFGTYDQPSFEPNTATSPTALTERVAASFPQSSPQEMRKRIKRRRSSNGSLSFMLFREEGRAVTTSIMVIGSFIVCYLPYFVIALLEAFSDSVLVTSTFLNSAAQLLLFLVCFINPFIYVYRNNVARQDALRLFRCSDSQKHKQNANMKSNLPMRPQPTRMSSAEEELDSPPSPSPRLVLSMTNGDLPSPPTCNGVMVVVTSNGGVAEPGLVRKLSQRVAKSVSLAEDMIIKSRRSSMRRHNDGREDDDQVIMVENCEDMMECNGGPVECQLDGKDSQSVHRTNSNRSKKLSLKRLTRSLTKNINQCGNVQSTNDSNNNSSSGGGGVQCALVIENVDATPMPFRFSVDEAFTSIKRPRIITNDYCCLPVDSATSNNNAFDSGRKSEPDLSSAAAALAAFQTISQRSAVSANALCCSDGFAPGSNASTNNVDANKKSNSNFLSPIAPSLQPPVLRPHPSVLLLTNPFTELNLKDGDTSIPVSSPSSVSDSGVLPSNAAVLSSHSSASSSLSCKMLSQASVLFNPSSEVTVVEMTGDEAGNAPGWPTRIV